MACKEDRYALGDRTYLIRQMPPRQAVVVEVFLAKTLGRPLFQAFSTGALAAASEDPTAMAIGLFADRLDDVGLMKTMQSVFRYVGILDKCIRVCEDNDDGVGIDQWFEGRNRELWQVFIKALGVNFGDFFVGALSLSSLGTKLRATILPSLPTSTSSSGGPASVSQSSAGSSDT